MSKKCDIVRDLMPMCIDGTASETARKYVDEHVSDCKPCRTVYMEMKGAVPIEPPREDPVFADAVKTMQKKRKRRTWRSVLLGMVGALLAVFVLVYAYCWYFVEEQFIPVPNQSSFSFSQTDDAGNVALMYTSHVPSGATLKIRVSAADPDGDGDPQHTAYLSFWATRNNLRNEEAKVHYILGSVQDDMIYMSQDGENPVQIDQMIYGTNTSGGMVIYLAGNSMETVGLFGLSVKTPDDLIWDSDVSQFALLPIENRNRQPIMVYQTPAPTPMPTPMPSPTLQPAGR